MIISLDTVLILGLELAIDINQNADYSLIES